MLGTLDGHALVSALTHGGEHADGRREPEGAGVVDHEGGRRLCEAFRGRRHKPRKQEVPRNEAVREVLAARLDLALELLCCLDEAHDGAELGRGGLGAHADDDLALFYRGAGKDVVAGHALHGERLAGERRLIDHGLPAHHHAVDAHGHTGARHDEVARAEALGGHGDLLAVLEATRALGDGHERADELVLGARAGGVLESLAQIEQEHGACRGLWVALDKRQADGRGVEYRHIEAVPHERGEAGAQKPEVVKAGPYRPQCGREEPAADEMVAH